MVLYIPSP
jgi:hypothetical protein